MGTAHDSAWTARLRASLAALALVAACRRGEPTTTSGPPANVPGPDAAEPRWTVEIVDQPPLATYPDLAIRAVYPDGDVLVVPPVERTAQMALERRGPGGVLRWRTTWKDHRDFHVAVTAADTWVLALGERPKRVSPRTQLTIDDPGPNPLALARLRSADGVIEATTVLVPHIPFEDRRYGLESAFLLPHDDGIIVAAPGPGINPLRKFNHDLTLAATIPVPLNASGRRWPVELDVSTRGEICARPSARRVLAQISPSLWCLDRDLGSARFIRYPEGADEIWHDGPRVVGAIKVDQVTGYQLNIQLPGQPLLHIESSCRWRQVRSLWDSFQALSCDHDCAPPPCQEALIALEGLDTEGTDATVAFSFVSSITIAGQPVVVPHDTLATITLQRDRNAKVALHHGCMRPRFWGAERLLIDCGRNERLIPLR